MTKTAQDQNGPCDKSKTAFIGCSKRLTQRSKTAANRNDQNGPKNENGPRHANVENGLCGFYTLTSTRFAIWLYNSVMKTVIVIQIFL